MGRRERLVKVLLCNGEIATLALSCAKYLEEHGKAAILPGQIATDPELIEAKTR